MDLKFPCGCRVSKGPDGKVLSFGLCPNHSQVCPHWQEYHLIVYKMVEWRLGLELPKEEIQEAQILELPPNTLGISVRDTTKIGDAPHG